LKDLKNLKNLKNDSSEKSEKQGKITVDWNVPLNAIIKIVTSHRPLTPGEMEIITPENFVITYPIYVSTDIIFLKLIERYMIPVDVNDVNYSLYVKIIRDGICNVAKGIIENNYQKIERDSLYLWKSFILSFGEKSYIDITSKIINEMKHIVYTKNTPPRPQPSIPKTMTFDDLFEIKPIEISHHLAYICYKSFSQIEPQEFFGQAWSKKPEVAINIRNVIDRFNQMSRWVTTEIVNEEKIRKRVIKLKKFIKIAYQSSVLKDFQTTMCLVAGINDGPSYRLKHTRAEIPEKYAKILQDLEQFVSPQNGYTNYKTALAKSEPPCIPYVGLYLRDLVYIEEGGGKAKKEGYINTRKGMAIYEITQVVKKYQQVGYNCQINDQLLNYLENLTGLLDEEALDKISNQREPRNSNRNEIV